MTPWLRTLRATGLVGALAVGAVVAPYGSEAAHGAGSGPAGAVARAVPSPEASGAAFGREPGRGEDAEGSGGQDGQSEQQRPDGPGRP
ncbi:hypothetical protein NG816_13245, partial [Streptomyces sp. A13(2022)]|nr:hypothetical protein [Streptomyces sp. A13(2022)]